MKICVNAITASRFLIAALFGGLVTCAEDQVIACVLIYLLILLTDCIDGKLARRYQAETRAGAALDVIADFFAITVASVSLCIRGILPALIIIVITLKFAEFWVTSVVAFKTNKNKIIFLRDPLGRVVAAMFYGLPVSVLVLKTYWQSKALDPILWGVYICIFAMSAVSSWRRIASCASARKRSIECKT